MPNSDPAALVRHVAAEFERRGAAVFELRHNQHDDPAELELARIARATLHKVPLLRNGGYTAASGEADLAAGLADAIVYGKPYIANPDLVERFRRGAALNPVDFNTLYTGGTKGYLDYPPLAGAAA